MSSALFVVLHVAMPSLAQAIVAPTAQCTCIENGLTQDGNGMIMADLKNNSLLPGSYGSTCGEHQETFAPECVDGNGDPKADAAAWCSSAWCWVDPCTCKLADVGLTSYFNASLYYSYSNCGGVDTYTSVQTGVGSCPIYNYTPRSDCQPRMASDYPQVDCTQFGVLGKCRVANVSGTMVNYPATYGEGCGVHAEPGAAACSESDGTPKAQANRSGWCDQAFSWVNPCECQDGSMAVSTYFPGLYYSYGVCGATDTYTTAPQDADLKALAGCPSPAPPAATLQSPGNYPGSSPVDQKCQCLPFPSDVPLEDCTTDYAQGGKCVNATKFPGFYPANYGTTCGVHLEPLSSDCFDVASGRPWASPCRGNITSGCRKSWCDSAWCWVDPCACTDASITDIAKSSWFPHTTSLYYSYANCKGVDTFTPSNNNFDRDAVCSNTTDTTTTDTTTTDTNSTDKGTTSTAVSAHLSSGLLAAAFAFMS